MCERESGVFKREKSGSKRKRESASDDSMRERVREY